MGRRRKIATDSGGSAEPDSSPATPDEVAYRCGLVGCNVLEAESKLGSSFASNSQLLAAYQNGKAEHAFAVMQAIFDGAMSGKEKLLLWLAENSLKRTPEAGAEEAVFSAMTPEQRRDEIKRLTRKLAIE